MTIWITDDPDSTSGDIYRTLGLTETEFSILQKLATVVVAAVHDDQSMMPPQPTDEEEVALFQLCKRIKEME